MTRIIHQKVFFKNTPGCQLPEEGGSVTHGSKKTVTDGRFTEGKEVAGGYLMIKAGNLAEAVALSKGCRCRNRKERQK